MTNIDPKVDIPASVPVTCPICGLPVQLDWAAAPVAYIQPGWTIYVAGRLDLTELEAHMLTHRYSSPASASTRSHHADLSRTDL